MYLKYTLINLKYTTVRFIYYFYVLRMRWCECMTCICWPKQRSRTTTRERYTGCRGSQWSSSPFLLLYLFFYTLCSVFCVNSKARTVALGRTSSVAKRMGASGLIEMLETLRDFTRRNVIPQVYVGISVATVVLIPATYVMSRKGKDSLEL